MPLCRSTGTTLRTPSWSSRMLVLGCASSTIVRHKARSSPQCVCSSFEMLA
jgi:hypothetical protein